MNIKSLKKDTANILYQKRDLAKFNGNCFLGIDAGSTTSKIALIDVEREFTIFCIQKQ